MSKVKGIGRSGRYRKRGIRIATESKHRLEAREANAKQIARYLEFRPAKLETRGGVPDSPISRRERGSSRLPVNMAGNLWIEEGVKFHERTSEGPQPLPDRLKYLSTLHGIIEAYRTGREAHGRTLSKKKPNGDPGILFSDVINELWTNPTAVADWHDGDTEEDVKRRGAFRALCKRIAGEFAQLYPGVEIKVEVSNKILRRRAEERAQVAREDAGETKQSLTADRLRVIHLAWLGVKTERGVGSEEAKQILWREMEVHPKKTERAITMFGKGNGSAA